MPSPKVLIIGGGLGGLTLAQSLRSQGIEFELFEREEGPHARIQGWAVALTRIIPSLRQIVPSDAPPLESTSVSAGQPEPDSVALYNAYTAEHINVGQHEWVTGNFIRVNRAKFRHYLLTGLSVKWNSRFTHYEITESGGVKAFFEDGTTAVGDILVGADGLRSRVRHTLYQPNPPTLSAVPAGVIAGELTLDREQVARQTKLARSFYICIDKETRMHLFVGLKSYSEDLSQGHYYWLFYFHEGRPDDSWVKSASKEELLAFVKKRTQSIHSTLREIIDLQKPEGVSQAFVMYDRVPEICPPGPVTLLGDATHPMTPLRGDGANNAMQDSIELGQKLGEATKAGTSLQDALRDYEKLMVPRAAQAVLMSRDVALHLKPE